MVHVRRPAGHAGTGHVSGKDPYYLYGASNLGSMLALVAYPMFVEPNFILQSPTFELGSQNWFWTAGYAVLVVMVVGCAAIDALVTCRSRVPL